MPTWDLPDLIGLTLINNFNVKVTETRIIDGFNQIESLCVEKAFCSFYLNQYSC